MATTDLLLRVAAQTAEAQKDIKKFTTGVEKSLVGIGVALGAVFSVKSIVSFARKSLDEFGKIEQATKSLTAALDAYGKASDQAIASATEFAETLDQTTRFQKENILGTQALIASLTGLSGDGLNRATQAAADLATVLNTDIESAGRTLAKVASGNTAALNRLGITFEKSADPAKNLANALTAIEDRLGGRAQKDALTLVGSLELLSKQFDNVFESVGTSLAQQDFFVPLIRQVGGAIEQIGILLGRSVGPIIQISKIVVSSILEPFAQLFSILGIGVSTGIESLTSFQKALLNVVKAGVVFSTFITGAIDLIDLLTDIIVRTILAVGDLGSAISNLLTGKFKKAANDARQSVDRFSGAIDNSFSRSKKVIEASIDPLNQVEAEFNKFNSASKAGATSFDKLLAKFRAAKLDLNLAGLPSQAVATAQARLEAEKKADQELNKQREEAAKRIGQIAAEPFKIAFDKALAATPGAGVAAAVGGVGSILQGDAGAKSLVSGFLGQVADQILPGIGGVVSQIVGVLAEGPDKVRETVQAFTKALPSVITNIVRSIPVLVEEILKSLPVILNELSQQLPGALESLIQSLPGIIQRLLENQRVVVAFTNLANRLGVTLVAQAPSFISALVRSLISQAPSIAVATISAFIKNIPSLVAEIFKQISRGFNFGGSGSGAAGKPQDIQSLALGGDQAAFGKLNVVQQTVVTAQRAAQAAASAASSIGNAIGGFFKSIFKRADGGLIPGSSPFVDRVPTLLTPGELVIDRSQNNRLDEFLNRERTGERDRDLLNQILSRLDGGGGEKNLTVNLMIGEDQLASALLNLNRRGFRMST